GYNQPIHRQGPAISIRSTLRSQLRAHLQSSGDAGWLQRLRIAGAIGDQEGAGTKQIVVFGATGYTGRLVVAALAGRGLRPVLAGRSQQRLRELSERHGGPETARAPRDTP